MLSNMTVRMRRYAPFSVAIDAPRIACIGEFHLTVPGTVFTKRLFTKMIEIVFLGGRCPQYRLWQGREEAFNLNIFGKFWKELIFRVRTHEKQIILKNAKMSHCQATMKNVKNSREVQYAKRLKVSGSAKGHIRLTALEDSWQRHLQEIFAL